MTIKNYFRLLIEGRYRGWETSFWKPILFLLSGIYRHTILIRRAFYQFKILKPRSLSIPVVSIGNLSWGGVGKTPITMYISRFLLCEQKVPLVLTRGYGSDESREYAEGLPQAILGIGKNRFSVARGILKSKHANVAILDDGFQHWQLHRDLEVVVINALNPFGNGVLIPFGILREEPASLNRAEIIIFNDVNLVPRKSFEEVKAKVKQLAPKAQFLEAQREPLYFYWARSKERVDLERLRGKRITTFSGVGTPRSFQLLLSNLGVKTIRNFEFCDHHPFSEREIREVIEVKESSQSDYIVTTEKDLLRKEKLICEVMNPLVLKISLRIMIGDHLLKDRLRRLLGIQNSLEPKSAAQPTNHHSRPVGSEAVRSQEVTQSQNERGKEIV